jgi:hypothetical protein
MIMKEHHYGAERKKFLILKSLFFTVGVISLFVEVSIPKTWSAELTNPVQPAASIKPSIVPGNSDNGAPQHIDYRSWNDCKIQDGRIIKAIHLLSYFMGREDRVTFNSRERIAAITPILLRNNFFQLNDEYINSKICDGAHDAISVEFSNKSVKNVHVINYYPAQFRQIQNDIGALGWRVPACWPESK